jgi:ribonuclease BN (tRNA processing enzyme)
MADSSIPTGMTLRAYNVGFGDCFLLSFHYEQERDRIILIDFGNKHAPKDYKKSLMVDIANDIKAVCEADSDGRLDAVVATHRHQDHISGFTTNKNQNGSGDIIASCKPRVVIQPWTEHPKATAKDETAPGLNFKGKAFAQALDHMHVFAESALAEATRRKGFRMMGATEIVTVADNNTKNPSAVDNLFNMTKSHFYVYYGSKSGLEKALPGVEVRVLGPPTIKQSEGKIKAERDEDPDEFWALQSGAGNLSAAQKSPFRRARKYKDIPPHARWFVNHLRAIRSEELLGLVHVMDSYMNNTSIILHFTIGKTKLLFPGDAQIENWSYALAQEEAPELLKDVTLYKVGHHGSTNATPRKGLWNKFKNKGPSKKLMTVISTMPGVYPTKATTKEGTEVPRKKLVTELKANSEFHSTNDLKSPALCEKIEITF